MRYHTLFISNFTDAVGNKMNMKKIVLFLFLALLSAGAQAQQICRVAIIATTPDSDFVVNNDGTVTHTKTKLMWKRCGEGQTFDSVNNDCTGTATTRTWDNALQIPQTLNSSGGFAGYSDWRIPNIKELSSIVELKCVTPALNTTLFPGVSSASVWSSTINSGGTSKLVSLSSDTGTFDGNDADILRTSSYGVRLVRTAD